MIEGIPFDLAKKQQDSIDNQDSSNSIDKLIDEFYDDCQLRGITDAYGYANRIRTFAEFLTTRKRVITEISKEDLKDYLIFLQNERGVKFSTIKKRFISLNSFYTFLIDEGMIDSNPIPPFRKRYLQRYKEGNDSEMRQIISIQDAARLVSSILDTRDRAIVLLLFKTGMRIGELVKLDVSDVDLKEGTIKLKPTKKRSNRILFLDQEAIITLNRWLIARSNRNTHNIPALFISRQGERLCIHRIEVMLRNHADRVGLHDPKSRKLEDRFTPHCCRHWFTTHLIRAGMPRDFVKELRGDSRHEAIDIYNHIDKKELRESYLAHIPQLGI